MRKKVRAGCPRSEAHFPICVFHIVIRRLDDTITKAVGVYVTSNMRDEFPANRRAVSAELLYLYAYLLSE
jgi:hypothetical protein